MQDNIRNYLKKREEYLKKLIRNKIVYKIKDTLRWHPFSAGKCSSTLVYYPLDNIPKVFQTQLDCFPFASHYSTIIVTETVI